MPHPVTFFDHQEKAKRRSAWALAGFILTVLFTATAVSFFGGFAGILLFGSELSDSDVDVYAFCAKGSAGITLIIIAVSWAWRASALAAGPAGVMKSMRAWKVPIETEEADQRQLINVVEEMSIASGVPVPDVYIIDSTAINACAAGMEIDQAAIAVTRGAIVKCNREELQGIIAHEFSHILHGDMSLNTHMIAWLAGLFTLSEIGRASMEIGADVDDGFDSRESAGGRLVFIAIGFGIWVLGSIGLFFGKCLQARISRQREYLADASATQYTRNPEGLANALRKLGRGAVRGRMVRPPNDCGHMMFSPLRSRKYVGILSTHPPLARRIHRILPSWDGSYLKTMDLKISQPVPSPRPKSKPETQLRDLPATAMLYHLLEEHQMPDSSRLQAVQEWKAALDPQILKLAHDVQGARDLIYTLLARSGQPTISINEEDRLAIVDLALPALRQMPDDQKEPFKDRIKELSNADGQIDLFEYCLQKILEQNLEAPKRQPTYQRMRVHIKTLETEVNVMLSALSRLGSETSEDAARSFAKAKKRMFGFTAGANLQLLPASECGLDALDRACEKLPGLAPNFQQRLLLSGLAAIAEDDHLHPDELQAFRAFAAVMRIPVPPGMGVIRQHLA